MAKLVSVKAKKGEHFNKLLSRFKRKVRKSEHLIEYRNRQEYLKPSVVKRKQKLNAIREQELLSKLDKIEDGDTTVKLYSKKRKKSKPSKSENKQN
jgi:small subunit ribosomal protein S21